MLALEMAGLLVSVLNLVVTIAVAGSIMKLIRTLQQPTAHPQSTQQLVQPSYADIARLDGGNYDGFTPQAPNWDGVPRARE